MGTETMNLTEAQLRQRITRLESELRHTKVQLRDAQLALETSQVLAVAITAPEPTKGAKGQRWPLWGRQHTQRR